MSWLGKLRLSTFNNKPTDDNTAARSEKAKTELYYEKIKKNEEIKQVYYDVLLKIETIVAWWPDKCSGMNLSETTLRLYNTILNLLGDIGIVGSEMASKDKVVKVAMDNIRIFGVEGSPVDIEEAIRNFYEEEILPQKIEAVNQKILSLMSECDEKKLQQELKTISKEISELKKEIMAYTYKSIQSKSFVYFFITRYRGETITLSQLRDRISRGGGEDELSYDEAIDILNFQNQRYEEPEEDDEEQEDTERKIEIKRNAFFAYEIQKTKYYNEYNDFIKICKNIKTNLEKLKNIFADAKINTTDAVRSFIHRERQSQLEFDNLNKNKAAHRGEEGIGSSIKILLDGVTNSAELINKENIRLFDLINSGNITKPHCNSNLYKMHPTFYVILMKAISGGTEEPQEEQRAPAALTSIIQEIYKAVPMIDISCLLSIILSIHNIERRGSSIVYKYIKNIIEKERKIEREKHAYDYSAFIEQTINSYTLFENIVREFIYSMDRWNVRPEAISLFIVTCTMLAEILYMLPIQTYGVQHIFHILITRSIYDRYHFENKIDKDIYCISTVALGSEHGSDEIIDLRAFYYLCGTWVRNILRRVISTWVYYCPNNIAQNLIKENKNLEITLWDLGIIKSKRSNDDFVYDDKICDNGERSFEEIYAISANLSRIGPSPIQYFGNKIINNILYPFYSKYEKEYLKQTGNTQKTLFNTFWPSGIKQASTSFFTIDSLYNVIDIFGEEYLRKYANL